MERSRPRGRRRFLIRLGAALAALALLLGPAGYLGVALLTADQLTRPRNHASRFSALEVSPDAVPWSTRTADGLTLRGWYLPTAGRRHLIVLVHGLWGSRDDLAERGRDLHALGYDILLFDLRGHGGSDPSRLSMGQRERGDLRAALAWAESAGFPPDRVGWLGESMGASTLLMEAALNPKIRAAVVDSPYGNLPELLNRQLAEHSGLPRLFNPGILLAARFAFGVRINELVPIRWAQRWGDRPLLLIHGEADTIVPVAQARQIAHAAGPTCRAVTLPGVEHVAAYRVYPVGYVAAVDGFFRKHLTP